MRTLKYFLILLSTCSVSPAVAKIATVSDFFPNCAQLSDDSGRVLTVDPSAKSGNVYSSIPAALRVAKPGDTISLMTGDYGLLDFGGVNQGSFITIAAAAGQTPRFTKIVVGNGKPASHWRLTGLTISGVVNSNQGNLVLILGGDNIVFDHNTVESQPGLFPWRPSDTSQPDSPSSGISARQISCVSIIENHIHNVFHGIDFGGDQVGNDGKYFLVKGNVIDNFAGDGIEHYGSHVRIENNRITDGHDICNNQCVHSDGIQGWNYNHLPVHNSDVTIDGNTIISQVTPGIAMPIDTLQGITIFDGSWDDVRIYNNVVLVNAYHGISLYGVRSGSIVNNTLGSTNPAHDDWIMVNRPTDIPPDAPFNLVVRNNVLPGVMKKNTPELAAYWNAPNLGLRSVDDFKDAFVKFDRDHFAYDMHPSKGSILIGAGKSDGAPTTDIEGQPRTGAIDIGAYAHPQ